MAYLATLPPHETTTKKPALTSRTLMDLQPLDRFTAMYFFVSFGTQFTGNTDPAFTVTGNVKEF